jgi:hypothetical protein
VTIGQTVAGQYLLVIYVRNTDPDSVEIVSQAWSKNNERR